MTREEKARVIERLTITLTEDDTIYLADIS